VDERWQGRVKVCDKGHHVDDRLGRQTGDGRRSDVMQLHGWQDLGQARRLSHEPPRPRRVVLDYLNLGVAATGTSKVQHARRTALGWVAMGGHIMSFAASLAHAQRRRSA
jgi:hypothetical protein